jgi:hypothetical protein
MAGDLKISELPTDVVTLANGDKFAVADASDLSADAYCTAAEIKTYVNTAPVWAAGSATAGTWPKQTSGTLLSTPEAGAREYNGSFYATPNNGNRGVERVEHYVRLTADYTLANTTSAQKLFNATPNGALSLPTGLYFFDVLLSISAMSSTSGNAQFQLVGGGNAVVDQVLYHAVGVDGATNTAATQTGSTSNQSNSPASIVTAGTNTSMQLSIRGTFRVTTAGTIIPSIAQTNAAAAVVATGSYFRCWRAGGTTDNVLGAWS